MRRLIKALIYLDMEEKKMPALIADVKSELLRMNELYKVYGVGSIKVTVTGFDYVHGTGWGWETPVK